MGPGIGKDRQTQIYSDGFVGKKPKIPLSFQELEFQVKNKLSREAFGYLSTGAGLGKGILNNQSAFDKYQILPEMLKGSVSPDLSTEIFNNKLPYPFLFAPIGALELAHPAGDIELAEASTILSVPMIQSNQASFNMEDCARVLKNTDHWFQLYFNKSRKLVESLISRAHNSGSKAIVLTLDSTILGWRKLDLENAYLPFLSGRGIAQYTSDPEFNKLNYYRLKPIDLF